MEDLKGGGGFRPKTFGKLILSYELGAMARTCTNKLMLVLGPLTQCCPCEALDQKVDQKKYKTLR